MNLLFTLKRKDGKAAATIYADSMELTLKDGTEIRLEWENSEYKNYATRVRGVICFNVSVYIESTDEEFSIDSDRAKEFGFPERLQNAKPTYMYGFDNETDDSYDLLDEYQIENSEIVVGDDSYSIFLSNGCNETEVTTDELDSSVKVIILAVDQYGLLAPVMVFENDAADGRYCQEIAIDGVAYDVMLTLLDKKKPWEEGNIRAVLTEFDKDEVVFNCKVKKVLSC